MKRGTVCRVVKSGRGREQCDKEGESRVESRA